MGRARGLRGLRGPLRAGPVTWTFHRGPFWKCPNPAKINMSQLFLTWGFHQKMETPCYCSWSLSWLLLQWYLADRPAKHCRSTDHFFLAPLVGRTSSTQPMCVPNRYKFVTSNAQFPVIFVSCNQLESVSVVPRFLCHLSQGADHQSVPFSCGSPVRDAMGLVVWLGWDHTGGVKITVKHHAFGQWELSLQTYTLSRVRPL